MQVKLEKTSGIMLLFFLTTSLFAFGSFTVTKASSTSLALHSMGNKLLTSNGTSIVLKGMGYSYFAYSEGGSWMLPDGTIETNVWDPSGVQGTLNFMRAMNCNVLRLMLCVQLWLDNSNNYRNNIEYVITQAANRGIYTDVVFYNTNPNEGQISDINPWEHPGNTVLTCPADFVNLWGNVSSVLKDFPSVIFELWNEPNGNEADWFRVSQLCIDRIREVGATQPINVMYNLGVAYDWGNGGVNWLNSVDPPFDMSWANDNQLIDPSSNLIYSTHLYRFSFMNSSVKQPLTQSKNLEIFSYSDMLYALGITGVLHTAERHPLVIFEMSHNNWAYDQENESIWFNATLTILDQHRIGYCAFALPPPSYNMQQWSIVDTGKSPQNTWTGSGVANYALNSAGVILINHMGGVNYSDNLTHGSLDHFTFDPINSPQNIGTPFTITIRAVDSFGILVSDYNGTPTLTCSAGSIDPIDRFSKGVWSGQVTISSVGSSVTFYVNDGLGHTGISKSITVNPPLETTSSFGYSVVGSSVDYCLSKAGVAFRFTIPQGGSSQSICSYVAGQGGSVNMIAGVWADNNGVPGALLATSNAVSVGESAGWVNFPITYTFSSSGSYWLGLISSGSYRYWYDAGSTNQRAFNYWNVVYPTLPDPFNPTSWAYSNTKGSIYLTYNVLSASFFGFSSVGNSIDYCPPSAGVAFKYSIPQGGNTQSISAYVAAQSNSINMIAGIWSDNGGTPGALLATSSPIPISPIANWYNFPISCTLGGGSYWLGLISSGNYKYYYDLGSVRQRAFNYGGIIYPAAPNPFTPTSWAYGNTKGSIYLTYTTLSALANCSISQAGVQIQVSDGYTSNNVETAFSHAFSLLSNGGTLTIQKGTYSASTTGIIMESCKGVTVIFESGVVLTIKANLNLPVFKMANCQSCTLVNIQVDGNGGYQVSNGATGTGVWLYDCSNCSLTNGYVTDCAGYGFYTFNDVAGLLPNTVKDSVFTFCRWNGITFGCGVTTGSVTSATCYNYGDVAINCTVAYSSDVGISIQESGASIIGCAVHDMNGTADLMGSWGIATESGSLTMPYKSSARIINNTVWNCIVGISLGDYGGSNYVANNTVFDCADCIHSSVGNDVITGNIIRNWGSYTNKLYPTTYFPSGGITTFYPNNNDTISSNILVQSRPNARGNAIYLEGLSDFLVYDNTIIMPITNPNPAIYAYHNVNNTIIQSNIIQASQGIVIGTWANSGNNNVGYTNIGSTVDYLPSTATASFRYRMLGSGSAKTITAYVAGQGGPVQMIAGIWADNEGIPGDLLATSNAVTVDSSPSMVTFPISYSFSGSGTYWIGLISNGPYMYYYDTGLPNQAAIDYYGVAYPNLPNPFNPTNWAWCNRQGTIFITYVTANYCCNNIVSQNDLSACGISFIDYGHGTLIS